MENAVNAVQVWWMDHRRVLLRIAIVLMIALAVYRLWIGLHHLICGEEFFSAIDLKGLYRMLHRWFDGRLKASPYYPPAFAMLWPFLGWLDFESARRLWAATMVLALGGLIYVVTRQSRAHTVEERIFAGMIPLSMFATGSTITQGQLGVHVLSALVGGIVLMNTERSGWRTDLLAALLILFSLVKPTLSAPFFWIVLFRTGRLRPAALVILGYSALWLLSSWAREPALGNLAGQVAGEFQQSVRASAAAAAHEGSYANLHTWLAALGLKKWAFFASGSLFGALGIWCYRHRHKDLWLLIGVSAMVARLWTYHRLYDDVLLLLPLVALFRLAKGEQVPGSDRTLAGILAGTLWADIHAPAWILLTLPSPWDLIFKIWQPLLWVAVLGFFVYHTTFAMPHGTPRARNGV